MCMVSSSLEVHRGYSSHSFNSQNNLDQPGHFDFGKSKPKQKDIPILKRKAISNISHY